MLVMCNACGTQQATTDNNLCADCAELRRLPQHVGTFIPAATAALSATALAFGVSLLISRALQSEEGPPSFPWTRRGRLGGSALESFCRDLTAEAAAGQLDPVVGRDEEIERVVAILARRSKNNPVLLGEPGVGKTAIVEGLAQRIAQGIVPASLLNKRVLSLSVGRLVAGTKYRGEFEGRVKRILDEVQSAGRTIILFIDELHALVGAGGSDGALDLSAMIKPELARGELQCIGATTFNEYRRYIESDAALERRFQPVTVAEPSVDATIAILNALRERYGRHHAVTISDEAIQAAVVLGARYIVERNFPDKAIDLIDEASSSTAMRGEHIVTRAAVEAVVAKWTGIPQGNLSATQSRDLLDLEQRLRKRIVGQPEALARVSESIRRAMAGLHDPRRPVGTFLFCGPSGVGKTALARALAEALFGDGEALIRIDMSEYTESHSLSRLIGAPPGYAGHDEPGLLSEQVRRRPYSVVLFDEIERAHPDIASLVIQILGDGRLTDAKGRVIEFRHAIIVVTSNLDEPRLRRRVRTELIDRIDELVNFKTLDPADFAEVVQLELAPIRARLAERDIQLDLAAPIINHIVEHSSSSDAGARNIARSVTRLVATPISRAILNDEIPAGSRVGFSLDGDVLRVVARQKS
jgi:ATP-dependent Clp protease ATP-binding subunit ClpC